MKCFCNAAADGKITFLCWDHALFNNNIDNKSKINEKVDSSLGFCYSWTKTCENNSINLHTTNFLELCCHMNERPHTQS